MVIDRYEPIWGGAENQLRQLSRRLEAIGVQIKIVTRRWESSMKKREIIDDVPVIRIGWPGTGHLSTIGYTLSLISYLSQQGKRVDVIHTHGAAALGAVGSLAARLSGVRNVAKVATAGRISNLARSAFGKVILSVFKRSDAIVCMTEEIQDELDHIGVEPKRILRIPNGVDTSRFRPFHETTRTQWRERFGLHAKDIVLVFSGRFVPRKGIDFLIAAWPDILEKIPTARLILLGSGRHQPDSIEYRIRRDIEEKRISHVYFAGDIRNPELYLGIADIFAFPSRREGFPNALLEAMAAGLSPVAFSIGGVRELLTEFSAYCLAECGNLADFRCKIIRLAHDPDLRSRIGSAARRFVHSQFSFDRIANNYLAAYSQLKTP